MRIRPTTLLLLVLLVELRLLGRFGLLLLKLYALLLLLLLDFLTLLVLLLVELFELLLVFLFELRVDGAWSSWPSGGRTIVRRFRIVIGRSRRSRGPVCLWRRSRGIRWRCSAWRSGRPSVVVVGRRCRRLGSGWTIGIIVRRLIGGLSRRPIGMNVLRSRGLRRRRDFDIRMGLRRIGCGLKLTRLSNGEWFATIGLNRLLLLSKSGRGWWRRRLGHNCPRL